MHDDDRYYILDGNVMQTGIYDMDWSTGEFFDCEKGYTRDLPYEIGWAAVDLGESGGVSLEQLPVSQGMPKEQYEKMLQEFSALTPPALSDDAKWSAGDAYIGTALAEHDIYSYQVIRRHQLREAFFGGFSTVYYVYIPSKSAYKYLSITFTVDLMGNPIYCSNSL